VTTRRLKKLGPGLAVAARRTKNLRAALHTASPEGRYIRCTAAGDANKGGRFLYSDRAEPGGAVLRYFSAIWINTLAESMLHEETAHNGEATWPQFV